MNTEQEIVSDRANWVWYEFAEKTERQYRADGRPWNDVDADDARAWWTATEERVDFMVRYNDANPLTTPPWRECMEGLITAADFRGV